MPKIYIEMPDYISAIWLGGLIGCTNIKNNTLIVTNNEQLIALTKLNWDLEREHNIDVN